MTFTGGGDRGTAADVVDLRPGDPVTDDEAEPEAIRGMMPSLNLLKAAQVVIAEEREAARRWQRLEAVRAATRAEPERSRWPAVALVVALAIGCLAAWQLTGNSHSPKVTAVTAVEEMPWRAYSSPSGTFDVQLPAKPLARAATSAAGPGQELLASIPSVSIVVGSYTITGGEAAARAAALDVLSARADALNGHLSELASTEARVGTAFAAEVDAGQPVALMRVVIVGSTLYLIEVDGDVTLPRTRGVYDQVALSFTPTNTH